MLIGSLRPRLAGFTLVELLVALVLFGLVATAVTEIVLHQQQFYDVLRRTMIARRAVHDGAAMLRGDLRAVAPSDGGIYAMNSDALDFRLTTGASVICAIDSGRNAIHIPPRLTRGDALTFWIAPPQRGDTILVYDAALDPDSARWRRHTLIADTESGGQCGPTNDFMPTTGTGPGALRLRITPSLALSIGPGAAMRVVRPARYQVYRATDNRWYLGFLDCLATRPTPCSTIQPVSGPYAASGVSFIYRDSSAMVTDAPGRVTRIDVLLRGEPRPLSRTPSIGYRTIADSLAITIALRNQ